MNSLVLCQTAIVHKLDCWRPTCHIKCSKTCINNNVKPKYEVIKIPNKTIVAIGIKERAEVKREKEETKSI